MRRALPLLWLGLAACWPGPRVGEPIDAGADFTFSRLKAEIFTPTCAITFCHAGDPPPLAPMSLEADNAHASLLADSVEVPALKRVAPGDPSMSYVLHKLKDTAGAVGGTATRMPLGKPPLSAELIDAITRWIERGAPND